jgi:hypothetical protein
MTTQTERVDVLAVLLSAVRHPNFYTKSFFDAPVSLAVATDPKWRDQIEDAKEKGREAFRKGHTCDSDGQLCAVQREQLSQGVQDVRISNSLRGWNVRTDWADGVILFRSSDVFSCIEYAMEWHSKAPDKRGVRMWGEDYRETLIAALARIGGDV